MRISLKQAKKLGLVPSGTPQKPRKRCDLAEALARILKLAGITGFEREYRFHPTRKFRFDLAWPDLGFCVECEGGIWVGGRHTRPSGFIKDIVKYNLAAMNNWLIIRVTAAMIKSGEALELIEEMIHAKEKDH